MKRDFFKFEGNKFLKRERLDFQKQIENGKKQKKTVKLSPFLAFLSYDIGHKLAENRRF